MRLLILISLSVLYIQCSPSHKSTIIESNTTMNTDKYPQPKSGEQKYVITLPQISHPEHKKVELYAGKYAEVDRCNQHFMDGEITIANLKGWGYDYYRYAGSGMIGSTLMACPTDETMTKYVHAPSLLIDYNADIPIVIYTPRGMTVRYKLWNADEIYKEVRPLVEPRIQDCPSEKIVNRMPRIGSDGSADEYYIYQGERREIAEFDAEWLREHCYITVTEVH